MLSSRTLGIGGTHAADTYDMGTIFNNPAGFQKVEPQAAFAEISLGLRGPIFDITDLIVETVDTDTNITSLLSSSATQSLLAGLYAGMNLVGPIYFGYVGNGLGVGLFNNTDITFQETAPLTLEATIKEELLLCGGYSFRVPLPKNSGHILDLGILLKGGLRGVFQKTESFANLINLDISLNTLLEAPFSLATTIGLDVGILYSFDEILSVGITAMDLFSPTSKKTYTNVEEMTKNIDSPLSTEDGRIPMSLNFGVGITPPLGPLDHYLSRLMLYIDYRDILGIWLYQEKYKNPWLHLGIGLEFALLEILSLQVGLNEGLMSAGLGIDMKFFSMNVAMFGRELSAEPGIRSIYNLMVGFEFRY